VVTDVLTDCAPESALDCASATFRLRAATGSPGTGHESLLPHEHGGREDERALHRRSVYVLVAVVKKRLKLGASLYTLLQVLSVTLFEKLTLRSAHRDAKYAVTSSICWAVKSFEV
jgi:hypothetical protein